MRNIIGLLPLPLLSRCNTAYAQFVVVNGRWGLWRSPRRTSSVNGIAIIWDGNQTNDRSIKVGWNFTRWQL